MCGSAFAAIPRTSMRRDARSPPGSGDGAASPACSTALCVASSELEKVLLCGLMAAVWPLEFELRDLKLVPRALASIYCR